MILLRVIFPLLYLSAADVCPRPDPGGTVTTPPEVTAINGRLRAALSFRSQVDPYGITRYCYIDRNNTEAPTLRVKPGDEVILDLKNDLENELTSEHRHAASACSAGAMTALSTNLHFHGLTIPPVCHQDDVLHTSIQPSEPAFQYRFRIPADQPPGLYWYHPHPHGYSERQVLGGASGALIVEGIATVKPQVADLPERLLILRDQPILGPRGQDDRTGKDISLNFVPVMYPLYMPAVMKVKPNRPEFWRVLNASADTYFDLQVITVEHGHRVPQNLQLIAMDGTPAADPVSGAVRTAILVSPGARAEFIVTTAPSGAFSQIVSRKYDTGPDGAANADRVIANIISDRNASAESPPRPPTAVWSFTDLRNLRPVRTRKLYFSEDREDLRTPGKSPKYFVTLEGNTPAIFDMSFKKPDITVRQGTIEDWIVENRAREAHVFHIHQLHFQLLERAGVKAGEAMLRDTIDLPYWDGKSAQYPSVKLRMDFRSPEIVGKFLFHCHILEHEDAGMMGSVEVVKGR
jgi:FtsP/CotA-like multicopper oxidase with cupredoxin domain